MKTNLMLKKVHLNLSVMALLLSVVLLLSTVLCREILNRSLGTASGIGVIIIVGMMVSALVFAVITYTKHKKIDTFEKWSLSLLGFGMVVLSFLWLYEYFLKP
ncbi:hypothetical protein N7603_02410 [Acholeplasma vituli]|uniref:Uncharacterized protein n=1 Tax=Paracholeplasma vituli TaxID=69473 RepID=A0ABT2PU74_9MOLU|nr:hypothetical protein [Paracholeplasma vituli]MCU0104503.1 hypothetical protein [Paracholeplasma vituli]